MATVAVIIPCFNGSAYLSRIAATLALTCKRGEEIIFVDDGSSDGSAEQFAALVPQALVIRKANGGVASARNAGAEAAHAPYLQFLDVDDAILPGKLEAQSALAESSRLDVVYSDWQMLVVRDGNETREPLCTGPMPDEPVAALLGGWWAPPHAYLIRTAAYRQVGGSDASLVNAQDFDLLLRLAIDGARFAHLPGHFADYYRYMGATSLARGPRPRYWADYESAVEKALGLLRTADALDLPRRRAAALKLHSIARSVYSIDEEWFHRVVRRIREIDPQFTPQGTMGYRLAVRALGLAGAERAATVARRWKGTA